jgi:hypothetical protein
MTDTTVVGTYDPANLAIRDRIRALIADTGPTFLIPDISYDTYIAESTDWRVAAANAADQLASIYAKRVSSFTAQGDASVSYIDRAADMRKLSARLRLEAAMDAAANVEPTFYRSVVMERDSDVDDASEYRSPDRVRWY